MHTRDYSEQTSKIIDDEVERILRAQEERATEVLSKHRGGLNAIARALLDNEIIDGADVARLVDKAHGSPVHGEGTKSVPHFHEAAITPPAPAGGNGSGNGHGPRAGTPVPEDGPVGVPSTPPPAPRGSEPESWPPPPWPPPADPSTDTPEGPPTH